MSGTYPTFEDKEFNLKIHAKKEFRDYQNKDEIDTDLNKKFEEICGAEFELTNHQFFVKNYLSPNTPYNSLLLYHGLGTGKTCSAINICEETRKIYKRIAYNKRIMIVASPNVQDNFKSQLFDDSKLKKENGIWTLNNTCVGNAILEELFPKQKNDLSKDVIIAAVKRFIHTHYLFMGYIEFANYIKKLEERNRPLKQEFENRLIVIDEVHNMKTTCEKKDTRCAYYLKNLIDKVKFMKLVFLTATPMFNSYNEIFEILNMMRSNDDLPKINESDIVDSEGNFLVNPSTGEEIGLNKFIDYSRGYVSYVRGENPYSFPFRITPALHSPKQSLTNQKSYPNYSPNKELINDDDKIKYLDLYMNTLSRTTFQYKAYQYVKDKHGDLDIATPYVTNSLNQILNFAYPDTIPDTTDDKDLKKHNTLYGRDGILRLMNYKETKASNPNNNTNNARNVNYSYKQSTITEYGNIFHPDIIGQYSHKLKNISDNIDGAEGIILIYSQYIEGGLIPTALMLEEMGFKRHDGENLLKTKATKKLSHSYVIISGDKRFSPNNDTVVSECSQLNNKDGSKIKVILISKAASEGIDFKFIRQVHILDPWYNLNRNEQIQGRAIRMCSHKDIDFEKRNVSVFFHSTNLDANEEASDTFLYRLCEQKALKIAKISRLLKQNAVDCMLNSNQTLFTEKGFNKSVKLILSNNKSVAFNVGDKSYTLFCDFDKTCSYECINSKNAYSKEDESTYTFTLLESNSNIVTQKIIKHFATNYGVTTFTHLRSLFSKYPETLLQYALDKIVDTETVIHDENGREGTLVVFGDFILFKPINVYPRASVYDRLHPSNSIHTKIKFNYKQNFDVEESDEDTFFDKINESLDSFFFVDKVTDKSNKSWFSIANNAIINLELNSEKKKNKFDLVVYGHLLDDLPFEHKIKLMNHIYSETAINKKDATRNKKYSEGIKNYIEKRSFLIGEKKAIIIQNEKTNLFVLDPVTNNWKPATHQEKGIHKEQDKIEMKEKISILKEQDNDIGFVKESNKSYIFKLKKVNDPKNTGHRCNQLKQPTVKSLCKNILKTLDIEIPENIPIPEKNPNIQIKFTNCIEYKDTSIFTNCVLLEFMLRHAHFEKPTDEKNKLWFFDVFEPLTISQITKEIKKNE